MNEMESLLWDIAAQSKEPLGNPWLDGLTEQVKDHVVTRHNYYRFLYHLMRIHRPMVAVELGVEFGLASAHMCVAAAEYGGTVVGIDIHTHGIPNALSQSPSYNYWYFTVASVEAISTMRRVCKHTGHPIGLVFQDSSHHYEESKREFELYSQLLGENAIWVCDDITPAFHDPKVDPPGKGMVQYFEELPGEKYLFPDVLHKGNTIGVALL